MHQVVVIIIINGAVWLMGQTETGIGLNLYHYHQNLTPSILGRLNVGKKERCQFRFGPHSVLAVEWNVPALCPFVPFQ